jgi:hypothetical protein
VRSLRKAYCDTDHYLVVETARERLSVRKRAAQMFDMERGVVRKPNEAEVTDKYLLRISNRFAILEKFDDNGDTNRTVKTFVITSKSQLQKADWSLSPS